MQIHPVPVRDDLQCLADLLDRGSTDTAFFRNQGILIQDEVQQYGVLVITDFLIQADQFPAGHKLINDLLAAFLDPEIRISQKFCAPGGIEPLNGFDKTEGAFLNHVLHDPGRKIQLVFQRVYLFIYVVGTTSTSSISSC